MNDTQTSTTARWLRLVQPWTTPLEPDAWLRTWRGGPERRGRPTAHAPVTPPSSNEPSVTWNGRHFDADGGDRESILELLERNGERPRFGCRHGVCRRCIVPLDSGQVRDMRDGRDIDAGTHVRICVTAPLDAVEVAGSQQPDRTTRVETEVA